MKEQKKMPWQEHSSNWDVPWDQRAEQKFDPDKVRIRLGKRMSISLSGVIALSIFFVSILCIVL